MPFISLLAIYNFHPEMIIPNVKTIIHFLYSTLHITTKTVTTYLPQPCFNLLTIRKVLTNKSRLLNAYMKAYRLFL